LALGTLQGLTEFLPVSSSGHLVLAQSILKGFHQPGILFDVALHLATAMAVVVYFKKELIGLTKRKDGSESRVDAPGHLERSTAKEEAEEMEKGGKLEQMRWKLVWMMVLALIPTGIIGLLLKDIAEEQFGNPFGVSVFLLLSGVILFASDIIARNKPGWLKSKEPGILQALIIGTAQGLAVFPGLSRSGATISAGIFSGVQGQYSARFSFLVSVPAVLGASLVEMIDERGAITQFQSSEILAYILGMASAFIVGYLSIRLVFSAIRKIKLSWFGGYCVVAGLVGMLVFYLGK